MTEQRDMIEAMTAFGLLTPEAAMAAVDQAEAAMVNGLASGVFVPIECAWEHRFTPGLYTRTITMPAGALITSKIHRTEHPFIIRRGRVRVWDRVHGVQELTDGHLGITQPGTRRVLFCLEETVWTTFHPTDKTTVDEVELDIIEPHINQLLEEQPCLG